MHLDRKRTSFGLAFALPGSRIAQAGEVFLPDAGFAGGLLGGKVAGAGVVDKHLEVHFGFAAKAFDVGEEVPLVGADRTPKRIVVGKDGGKAEGKDGGELEAIGDDAGMIAGGDGGFGS